MSSAQKPWLALYDEGQPASIELEYESALAMFKASVQRSPDSALIHYMDSALSVSDVDRMSDALAVGLLENGVQPGDRVAVYLQNVPQFVIGMVAIWKAGAIMVSINPMYRGREVGGLLNDSGAVATICLESLYTEVISKVRDSTPLRFAVTTSELDFQHSPNPKLFAEVRRHRAEGTVDLLELITAHEGSTPPPVELTPDSVAFLTYTSGTTGPSKGAMNTHRNVVFTARLTGTGSSCPRTMSCSGSRPFFTSPG